MAMRKDQIADNKFTLPNDARDLALYVRQITQNVKVFDPAIDANLPAQLRATADQIYFDIFEANGVRVDSADTKKERLALQKKSNPALHPYAGSDGYGSPLFPSFWQAVRFLGKERA